MTVINENKIATVFPAETASFDDIPTARAATEDVTLDQDGSDGSSEGEDEDEADEVDFTAIDEGDEGDEGDEDDEEAEPARRTMSLKDLMGPTLSDGSDSDYDAAADDDEDVEIEDEDEETGVTADNEEIVHNAKKPRNA